MCNYYYFRVMKEASIILCVLPSLFCVTEGYLSSVANYSSFLGLFFFYLFAVFDSTLQHADLTIEMGLSTIRQASNNDRVDLSISGLSSLAKRFKNTPDVYSIHLLHLVHLFHYYYFLKKTMSSFFYCILTV